MTQLDLFEMKEPIPIGEPTVIVEGCQSWQAYAIPLINPKAQKIIATLRKNAESLNKQAENVNTDVSGNWTRRRQSFADNAQRKKERLIEDAQCLNRLADLWENDKCPDILKAVRSRNDLYAYYPNPPDEHCPIGGWYREEYPKHLKRATKLGLKNKNDDQLFKESIKQLSEIILTPEQQKELKLKEELKKVHSYSIPGFFPTPDALIDKMIDMAELEDGLSALEPEAGLASIPERVKYHGYKLDWMCVEQQLSLHEIVLLKGYTCMCHDILDLVPGKLYDRILMNPPFEKNQDIQHVMHCFKNFLKPGGILVSIMSMSWTFTQSKLANEFRNLLGVDYNNGTFNSTKFMQKLDSEFKSTTNELEAYCVVNPNGSFKNSFNSTGVSTVIIKIQKS